MVYRDNSMSSSPSSSSMPTSPIICSSKLDGDIALVTAKERERRRRSRGQEGIDKAAVEGVSNDGKNRSNINGGSNSGGFRRQRRFPFFLRDRRGEAHQQGVVSSPSSPPSPAGEGVLERQGNGIYNSGRFPIPARLLRRSSAPGSLDAPNARSSENDGLGEVRDQPHRSSSSTSSCSSSSSSQTSMNGGARERESLPDVVKKTKVVAVQNDPRLASAAPGEGCGESSSVELVECRSGEACLEVRASSSSASAAGAELSFCSPVAEYGVAATAAAILRHSYLETLCGPPASSFSSPSRDDCAGTRRRRPGSRRLLSFGGNRRRRNSDPAEEPLLSDDPTVQESIECIFSTQLQDRFPSLLFAGNDEDSEEAAEESELVRAEAAVTARIKQDGGEVLVAPSILHQSLLKNRLVRRPSAMPPSPTSSSSSCARGEESPAARISPSPSSVSRKTSASVAQDRSAATPPAAPATPLSPRENNLSPSASSPLPRITVRQCDCCRLSVPVLPIDRWPQRPLLLRPTPESGTRVRAIRFAGAGRGPDASPLTSSKRTGYLWEAPGSSENVSASTLTWPEELLRHWNGATGSDRRQGGSEDSAMTMCPACMVMPANNGNEEPGESLVTDFESDLFVGTFMLRLRHSEGTTRRSYDDNTGYFCSMNRRYQAVITGRFKKSVPLTECTTGFEFKRPCGKLPSKWILKGAVKVVSFFAPQLEARPDGPNPISLTPLGSTPQCLIVEDAGDSDGDGDFRAGIEIEGKHEEPRESSRSLLGHAGAASSSLQRARARKKAFDKLYAQKSGHPMTDPRKIYTFEFLQHLCNFQEFSVELGSVLGSLKLKEILDGQPLQIMAKHGEERIWSFDVWHEALIEDAKRHEGMTKFAT